jgi:hypothetical protein
LLEKVMEDNKRVEDSLISMQAKIAKHHKKDPKIVNLSSLSSFNYIEESTIAIV